MGMPIKKHTSMVASRVKISMVCLAGSVERCDFEVVSYRIGGRAEKNTLDDEEQQAHAADRNCQVGDADRQERKVRDGVVPGHFDKPAAPDDHEERNQRHQQLNEKIEQGAESRRQHVGKVGNVHVQVEPISSGGSNEREHESDAADDDAEEIEVVHRSAK